MSYGIVIHKSAKTLETAHWNGSGLELPISMDQRYLLLLERLHNDQMDVFYASITDNSANNNIVGLIYFQSIKFKGSYLKNFFRTDNQTNVLKRMIFAVLSVVLEFLNWNLLLAGNIFFTGERGAYFANGISDDDAADLIHQCFYKVGDEVGKTIDGFMLNNVYNDGASFIHHYLNKFKYGTYPVDPDMFMIFDKSWNTFDDFLSALTSKYRVRLKKVLKVSESVVARNLSGTEMETHRERIHELYMCTANKVDFNLGYLDFDYFCEMKKLWGEDFIFIGYFEGEELIGFMSLVVVNSDVDVNYMGMDYDANQKYKLYNRMLADLIKLGIDMKTKNMHLGRTATEIKSTIGAQARGMKIYLNSPTGWKAKGIRFFEPYFGSPEYTLRHPFKAPVNS